MSAFDDAIRAARRTATPLLGVTTLDPAETMRRIEGLYKTPPPLFVWDVIQGLRPINDDAKGLLATLESLKDESGTMSPQQILAAATKAPAEALLWIGNCLPGEVRDEGGKLVKQGPIVFFLNAHRYLDPQVQGSAVVAQAVWNLRDAFKANRRTLVMLAPTFSFPAELQEDVVLLDEPLADDLTLGQIVTTQVKNFGLTPPEGVALERAIDAVRGLSAFSAEQVAAMSVTREGLSLPLLWERKQAALSQTQGLTARRPALKFDHLRGNKTVKQFGGLLLASLKRPRVIVKIDEFEKYMAGTGADGGPGDNTGVTQDQAGVLLRDMENNDWPGLLAVGPAGAGKTLFTEVIAGEGELLSIDLDLGGMKASRVGQSEQAIRLGMKRIKGVAGSGGAFFVATCNKLSSLAPEIRRRFRYGIWFFDLPTDDEARAIWEVQLRAFNLAKHNPSVLNYKNWTGADIRNVCEIADRLTCSLKAAAQYITPVAKSDPQAINALRRLAHHKFLSASTPGVYVSPGNLPLVGVEAEEQATGTRAALLKEDE